MISATCRSTEDYLDQVRHALRERWCVPEPRTTSELRALINKHPDVARTFLPPRRELRRLGISANACRAVEPFPVEFRERLIATVAADSDFRAAIAALLGGAA